MKRALGLAATAALATALIAAPAGAKTKTKTYSSGTVNIPIPDAVVGPNPFTPGVAAAAVHVKDKGTIKDVNVGVRITHTDTGNLQLFLFKGEKWTNLVGNESGGSSTANFGAGTPDCAGQFTVLDDASTFPIYDAANPFVGSFQPEAVALEHSLKQYNGDQSKGTWNLVVLDTDTLDTGTINCVTTTIKRKVG